MKLTQNIARLEDRVEQSVGWAFYLIKTNLPLKVQYMWYYYMKAVYVGDPIDKVTEIKVWINMKVD